MSTAIALILFNRPALTARVIAAIRAAQPARLYVIADGPRPGHPTDAARCTAAQAAVWSAIDWPCKVLRNVAATNLGCRRRIVTGLDWVFASEDRAVILEDDCLPSTEFFVFCDQLLTRYATDAAVGHIAGTHLGATPTTADSYVAARYFPVWGWATWRRAWATRDPELAFWERHRPLASVLTPYAPPSANLGWWSEQLRRTTAGLDTWDFQWTAVNWMQRRVALIPTSNLVTNIGFGADATHTTRRNPLAEIPHGPLGTPIRHPAQLRPDTTWERAIATRWYDRPWVLRRAAAIMRRLRG